jgi:hypothetical protein
LSGADAAPPEDYWGTRHVPRASREMLPGFRGIPAPEGKPPLDSPAVFAKLRQTD